MGAAAGVSLGEVWEEGEVGNVLVGMEDSL